jgi:hypothetical protein
MGTYLVVVLGFFTYYKCSVQDLKQVVHIKCEKILVTWGLKQVLHIKCEKILVTLGLKQVVHIKCEKNLSYLGFETSCAFKM